MGKKEGTSGLGEHLDKLEVLSEIYNNLFSQEYPTKQEKEVGKLKMQLVKKEMLLLNYLLEKEIEKIE